ncbi:MAG: carbon-nitrogen hydrolase family protein [Pseudolabrys sp.]|nr:carbon-nitrogen hydrolase family protein [Pseudolabrys sp.]
MAETVRVAVVQDCPVPFDLQDTIAKTEQLVEKAAKTGAGLIVFPEAFVSGYPKGLDFGARVGSRSLPGRDMFRRYFDSSLVLDSDECRRLGAAARKAKAYLVMGVMEKDGGTLYCTVLFFGPDGALLGKHRKLMPTASERLIWGFGDGSTLTVLDTPMGKLGAVICWENYMPLLRTAMYSKGIQIYCAPTADDRDTWAGTMQHVALEGRCFVLSACQYLTRGDCPDDYDAIQGDDPKTVLMRGGSCIVSPLGQMLAAPDFSGPAILTADLDIDDVARGKFDFDVTGHYARPDVFRLHVNERAMHPVSNSIGAPPDPFAE